MLAFLILLLVLCVYGMKLETEKGAMTDYLSVDSTKSVKGIFIILVICSHFNSFVTLTGPLDVFYRDTVARFGQTMVTLFMFYSGYGIMESIAKKGDGYVKRLPVDRVLATLFRFDCAVLLFAVLAPVLGQPFSLGKFLLSLVGWESLGNSNWYIFAILVLYLMTWVGFRLLGKHRWLAAAATAVMVCLYMVAMRYWAQQPSWWYDTVLCYVVGMFYSLLRRPIESIANKNRVVYVLVLLFLLAACALLLRNRHIVVCDLLLNILFAVTVVVITMRVKLGNPVLRFCGEYLFEVYILHRIPMIILQRTPLRQLPELYLLLCGVLTAALVVPFRWTVDRLWRLIKKN